MTTKLLYKLKQYEQDLDLLYEEDEELAQKIESIMVELKEMMKSKVLIETKIERQDIKVESIKSELVDKVVAPYSIDVQSLNSIEQDRLILMMKNNNNSKIEEVLIEKINGVDFGFIKTIN